MLVTTPRHLSLIALGGRADAVADGHQAAVANADGRALFSTGSLWKRLPRGSEQLSSRGDAAVERSLLPAPALALEHPLWLSTGSAMTLDGLKWKRMPGASGYRVRLLRDGALVDLLDTPQNHATFHSVLPGRYALVVQAVDDVGIAGLSARATLRVVGVALPDGAYTDAQGAIRLGPGQQLEFTHADGLAMTYSGANRFLAAPRPIGLVGGKRTVVMLRVPGTDDTVTAQSPAASTCGPSAIGPMWAVWPRDTIQISIRLHAPQHSLPERVEMNRARDARDDAHERRVAPRRRRAPGECTARRAGRAVGVARRRERSARHPARPRLPRDRGIPLAAPRWRYADTTRCRRSSSAASNRLPSPG